MRAAELCVLTHEGNFLRWPVDVAETDAERLRGLSHRALIEKPMVYPENGSTRLHFQMFDMLVPIDIAFVTKGGKVVAAGTRNPGEEYFYSENEPVFLVVEMPRGWVAKHRLMNAERVFLCEDS